MGRLDDILEKNKMTERGGAIFTVFFHRVISNF